MAKLLIIDDEEPLRRPFRLNLADTYEISDTGDPEQALALGHAKQTRCHFAGPAHVPALSFAAPSPL